ncbi:hypothetical protein [Lonepinella sp. BR2474]|uniref:hypothetical protein n=1 Tax=Lonepinella sp. BR2474 TaxID=3434548 RepID=UPI003F6E43F8
MLSNKIKLGLICGSLFLISQNVFAYGCNDLYLPKESYCTPDGSKLFKYGEVTQEMKNIKSTFRGKTYTYKDLIKPLNSNELIGIKEFTKKIENFNFALEDNLHAIKNYSQLEELLKVRGDYLEQILNNKFYNNSIINDLIDIDKKIISIFDKFKVSPENQKLFKTGSAEKHRTLEIMNNYIKITQYGI